MPIHVMQLVRLADGTRTSLDGTYLKSYDPDARGGRGEIQATHDPNNALKFGGKSEAMMLWKKPSKVHPIRLSDGKPNRPLTAWTVTILPLKEAIKDQSIKRPT